MALIGGWPGLLIAAANEWNRGGDGGRGREGREGGGDVEHINICCPGSVATLMLIEFYVIGPLSLLRSF